MKTLMAAVVLGAVVLAGSGAFAADTHQCAKGTHWDAGKRECVPSRQP